MCVYRVLRIQVSWVCVNPVCSFLSFSPHRWQSSLPNQSPINHQSEDTPPISITLSHPLSLGLKTLSHVSSRAESLCQCHYNLLVVLLFVLAPPFHFVPTCEYCFVMVFNGGKRGNQDMLPMGIHYPSLPTGSVCPWATCLVSPFSTIKHHNKTILTGRDKVKWRC